MVALEGITLELAPGEIVGLTGPSGAGKSTLCRIIAGIDNPDSGQVTADGREVTRVPAAQRDMAFMFEDRSAQIGRVFEAILGVVQSALTILFDAIISPAGLVDSEPVNRVLGIRM